MELPSALNVVFWVGMTVVVVFGVVLPLVVFVASMVEKQHVQTLRTFSEIEQRRHRPPDSVLGAMSQEDRLLGVHGYCDSGRKVEPMFLLLSGDGLVLARVRLKKNGKMKRYELFSRLHSGAWPVTSDTLSVDLSGLRWEEWLPDAPLPMALHHHRRRIHQAGQPCVPFAAETALAELSEHERQRVARLTEGGLARYVGPNRDKWVFTLRGAARLGWQVTGISRKVREGQARVEALKKESALPLNA